MTDLTQDTTRTPVSLSRRKQQFVRDAILDAAAEAIREDIDFSVQDVADRAGVTHRTVYRYFDSREAIVDGVAARFETIMAAEGFVRPETLDEASTFMERLFRQFDRFPDYVRAYALLALTRGERSAVSHRRTEQWRRMFEADLPHLPSGEVQAAFAVWRNLTGSIAWYLLRSVSGLSGDQSGAAVRWALEAMIADLRRRDHEAAAAGSSGAEEARA
jgi:AcrR family transcriptional regulator